jgi:putative tryptophan/tyrosine transport system substrate-binding protein
MRGHGQGATFRACARAGAALLALLAARPAAPAEVALLKSEETAEWRPILEAMKRTLTGHVVSEVDLRGDRAEAVRVVTTLIRRPTFLVAFGPLAAEAVRQAAPDAPLVYCMVTDPAALGLVGNPNTSGVAWQTPVKNQLAAFRLVYPRAVRIGIIHGPGDVMAKAVQEAQKASSVLRLIVVPKPVAAEKDVPSALRSLLKGDEAVDALWLPPDPLVLAEGTRRLILSESLKAGRPVLGSSAALVSEGALVSNAPEAVSMGEQAASLVSRILAGDSTARGTLLMPRAELVINKKIAEKLKIEIPADALQAASRFY